MAAAMTGRLTKKTWKRKSKHPTSHVVQALLVLAWTLRYTAIAEAKFGHYFSSAA